MRLHSRSSLYRFMLFGLSLVAILFATNFAFAGQPEPWQLNFQTPATSIKEDVDSFHDLLLWITGGITLFVTLLLAYVAIRFRRSKNPVPSKTTHNVMLEVVWTIIPVLILIVIAIPSFRLLYKHNAVQDAEMTIVAKGYQWYWGYEYVDHGGFSFLSYMVPDEDLKPGQPRLLQTDTEMVVPVDTKIRMMVTGEDVIHAWTIPAFGVKKDAVPGRMNEIWFQVDRVGTYYGQCSEICGTGHGFMPITVRVVEKEEFEEWVKWAQEEYASLDGASYNRYASLK